ncbi:MAG: hypothetical protein FJY37_06360 [Betaproteobacteria bacterium]|nr:hypothetical protein [Betaproteobacteria bacterium]
MLQKWREISNTRSFIQWLAAVMAALVVNAPAWSITPEEYAELAPEVALDLPMVEALTVFGWTRKEYFFIVENALIDLRYLYREPNGTLSTALMNAVREFQRSLSHSPTGSLRVNEFVSLVERANAFWQIPILPPGASIVLEGDVLSVEGTWASERVKDPDPVQTTHIRCRRDSGHCTMATAKVRLYDADSGWFHSGSGDLEVRLADLKVSRWEAQWVEASFQSYFCATDTLVVDLRANEARLHRARTEGAVCNDVKVQRDTFKLISGDDSAADYWDKRRDRAHWLRSPAFRARVEEIQRARAR